MRRRIGAVIEAYGRGEIELEAVDPKTNTGQVHAFPGGKAYTLATVARFLRWTKSDGQATEACRRAFEAYREEARHHGSRLRPSCSPAPPR